MNKEAMTTGDIQYLTEALTVDLAEMLSKDFNMSILESLDTLYNSETYQKLTNPDTGLYFQSSLYVYSYLKQEITTGKLA